MKKTTLIFFVSLIFIFLQSCASSTETSQTTETELPEEEVYVFDDVSDIETEPAETPVFVEEEVIPAAPIPTDVFIVQVGAFSTKERAERFKLAHQNETEWEMYISYSTKVGLYVIQLAPFETRSEAEIVRNKLWRTKTFTDSFIITETK